MVFRELAVHTKWVLKKLKRRGRERKREEKRGKDKETKRGRERKGEEGRGRGERAVFLKHECS